MTFARTSILAAFLALAGHAPPHAWAVSPGTSPAVASATNASDDSEESPNQPKRLLAIADFNHDGIADMAEVALPLGNRSAPRFLTLSLGQPNGTFKPTAIRLKVGPTPQAIVSGDFNHDGFPDLIVGDDDGTLRLFLGDGKGNLAPAAEGARLDSVVSIAVADFNHDGILDLAVSDWRASSLTVLLGTGNGAFRKGWSFPLRLAGSTPHLSTADFNHDGIPDLAVVYQDDDGYTFDVMLGTGNGAFIAAPNLSHLKDPNAACVP